MIATRNFNRFDGRQKDGGNSPKVDERMARQARQAERERRAAMRRVDASPVRNPRDMTVVSGNGTIDPLISKDFLEESVARLEIHLARGHWSQAKEAIDAIEEQWELRKIAEQASTRGITEKLSWHVSGVFDARTAGMIETVCSGTIGSLLEAFPLGFLHCRNCGTLTISHIGRTLLRMGVIDEADAQRRIEQYRDAVDGPKS